MVGGDVEIGALAAAFANGDRFTVIDSEGKETIACLGDKPICFRGSVMVPGRKRPLRHLLGCSQQLADTTADGKLLLVNDHERFIWLSLVQHYGLPALPDWGTWVISQLNRQKRIQSLPGFGYDESRHKSDAEAPAGTAGQRHSQWATSFPSRKRRRGVART